MITAPVATTTKFIFNSSFRWQSFRPKNKTHERGLNHVNRWKPYILFLKSFLRRTLLYLYSTVVLQNPNYNFIKILFSILWCTGIFIDDVIKMYNKIYVRSEHELTKCCLSHLKIVCLLILFQQKSIIRRPTLTLYVFRLFRCLCLCSIGYNKIWNIREMFFAADETSFSEIKFWLGTNTHTHTHTWTTTND